MTCAPCAVYAAFNAIPAADKGIRHGFGMTHGCFGSFYQELGNWLRADAKDVRRRFYMDRIASGELVLKERK